MAPRNIESITSTGARPADPRLAEPNEAIRAAKAFYEEAVGTLLEAERAYMNAQAGDGLRGLVDPDAANRAAVQMERARHAVAVASEELRAAKVARLGVFKRIRDEEHDATVARINAKTARKEAGREAARTADAHGTVEASRPGGSLAGVRSRVQRLVAGGSA